MRSVWTWAMCGWVAVLAMATGLAQISVDWATFDAAHCMPADCFCEMLRSRTIRQPSNAWSSSAFCAVGFAILGGATQRRRWDWLMGFVTVLMGLGSMGYHASLSLVGEWLDVAGMYAVILIVPLHNAAAQWRWSQRASTVIYLVALSAAVAVLTLLPEWRRELFAALLIGAGSSTALRWGVLPHRRLLSWALLTFGVAVGLWLLDRHRIACLPDSLLQGHAAWHVLNAASLLLLWRYLSPVQDERNKFNKRSIMDSP